MRSNVYKICKIIAQRHVSDLLKVSIVITFLIFHVTLRHLMVQCCTSFFNVFPASCATTTSVLTFLFQDILLDELQPETEYEISVAIRSAKGIGKVSQSLRVKTKQSPPEAPIFTSIKKLPSPQLGLRLNWSSSAREIENYRLRYTKHVDKITNITLLQHKARYVEKNFSNSQTWFTYSNFGR